MEPLITKPSSAQTVAQVISQSWPVRIARGVANSSVKIKPEKCRQNCNGVSLQPTHITMSVLIGGIPETLIKKIQFKKD